MSQDSIQESERLRLVLWESLLRNRGDRTAVAREFDKSVRTINRYIKDFDLYADIDRAGLKKKTGAPRAADKAAGEKTLGERTCDYIRAHDGDVNYIELANQLYGSSNGAALNRLCAILNDLKSKGLIAKDESRWFVL